MDNKSQQIYEEYQRFWKPGNLSADISDPLVAEAMLHKGVQY